MSFQPTDLPGCVFWVAADSITGLNDGDPVSLWSDLSGNGRHLVQNTASLKPLYKAKAVFGLPALRFDGIDDTIASATNAIPNGTNTITQFVVLFARSAAAADMLGEGVPGNNNSPGSVITTIYGSAADKIHAAGGDRANYTLPINVVNLLRFQVTQNPLKQRIYINGVLSGDANINLAINDMSGTTLFPCYVGAGGERGNAPDADIAEVVWYSRSLTDIEANQVESYLRGKYGMFTVAPASRVSGITMFCMTRRTHRKRV